ncbi:MAG: DUF4149 domain-containing protein [Rubrivivax sp.]
MPPWRDARRLSAALACAWFGLQAGVAGLGTTSVFALLPGPQAGPIVGRMLGAEATVAIVLGGLLILLERLIDRDAASRGEGAAFSREFMLALAAVFCAVAGHYALQPYLEQARAGRGPLSFGQLHAISVAFFVLKMGLVGALAWRAIARLARPAAPARPEPVSPPPASSG